ncbi:hypothetical protein DIPPA_18763 [Diplonema papillatum]|nr:hypothetical protein DIPPA_18763 [Diplonema papillatum]
MPVLLLIKGGKEEKEDGCLTVNVKGTGRTARLVVEDSKRLLGTDGTDENNPDGTMTKAERLHAAACPKWAHDPKLDTAAFDYLFGDKDGVTTESFDPCVTEIAEKLSRRENVTLVTLGQPRSGKSYAMHHILHRVVKKLADHIESSCELWDDHMANVVPLSSMRMSYDMSRGEDAGTEDVFGSFSPTFRKTLPSLPGTPGKASSGDFSPRGSRVSVSKSVSRQSHSPQRGSLFGNSAFVQVKKASATPHPHAGHDPLPHSPPASQNRRVLDLRQSHGGRRGTQSRNSLFKHVSASTPTSPQTPNPSAGFSKSATTTPTVKRGSMAQGPHAGQSPSHTYSHPANLQNVLPESSPSGRDSVASPRTLQPGGITSISSGNGRNASSCKVYTFNGQSSFMRLPTIPDLGKALASAVVFEFWFRQHMPPPGTASQPMCPFAIGDSERISPKVCCYLDMDAQRLYEAGSMMLSITDGTQRGVEAIVSTQLIKASWNHVQWLVTNLRENQISCKVNGDPLSVRIGCADGPVDFSNWKQQGTIGGRLEFDDPVALRDPFAGVVSELLIYEPVSRKDHELSNVIAYYPLESADARDVSGRAGPVEVTVDIEIEKCEDEFPYTAYKLNGHNTFVNVGQLGDFGCALNAFSVEIWLKTTETKKTMTMLGVTDTSHKHAGFGIDLNTSAFGRLVPHRTTCWVRDCSSHTYAASFEAAELFDGKWHCLRWHVYDAHLGKVKIEIDQHPYDIELSNPKPGKYPEFVPFTQWVCIGAQNNRGMVEKHFCGSVREAKLWKLAKDKRLIAHWPLNEGPGARIAVDVTGNGNGGIYFLGKKKMGQWECDKGLLRLANVMSGPRPVQQETERAGAPPLVKKYRNNRLQIACVAFGADPDESGAYKEVRYDVMHGDFFEDMDRVPLSEQPDISHRYPVDAASSLEVSALPAACFEPIKLATYKKLFIDLASRLQEDDLRACHTAFVLKLGDACFVGFDLMGQQLNRKTATFNPQHLTWVDAVATMGAIGRRRVAINKAVQAVQHGLMEIGSLPQLVKRCSTKSASVRQSIENAFIGTEMSLFVRSCLSYGDSPSSVYVLTTMLRHPTRDEYIASIAFAQAMHHRTQHWAALMIQKSMRAFLARARAALLSSARDNVRERLNHRSIARKSMPDFTETRSKKVAILVSASQLRHTAVARHPQATASVAALESILTKLGYQVHLFSYDSPGAAGPPEKTAVLNCIKRYSNQHDAEVFVYISAYGATGSFPRPVKAAKFCAWLTPWESDERDVLEETEKKARLALHKSEEVDQRDAVDAAQQREVEIQRKAARQKKRRQSQSVASTRAHDMKKQSVALHSDSQSRRSADTRSDRKSQRSDASPCVTAAAVDDIAPVTPRDSTVLRSSSIDIAPSMVSDDETDDVYSKYSTIATQYLIPSDAPRDIPADSVWFVDQLEDAVLGDKPILGRHAVLCFEARSISTVPSATNLAPAMHGSDVHSFASVLGSSRQGLSLTYGGGQCGALSHYLIKGLQGAAMYEAGGDDNGVIGIERLLAYLTKKLKKWSFNFVSEPFGTYVGEIAFAQQALVAKGSIAAIKLKEKHRKFKVQVRYHIDGRTCITEQLASRIHTHLNMVTKGQSSVDVKLVEVDPCISLFFRSSNDFEEATQNPALEQRWSKDVSSLMAGYRGPLKYTYSFGSHAGAFCLAVFPDTSRVTAARKAADQTALDRKEKVAAEQVRILEFIEYVRKEAAMSLDSGGGLALCGREVTAVAASATAVVAVASNASVEKISLGSCLSNKLIIQHFKESIKESVDTMKVKLDVEEGITLIGARQFTEQEEKDHAKWELEITIEQKRRAAVAKEARLAHIAAQKREEDEKLRLQKKKQSVLDWLKENDTGMMNAIDEPVLAMLFSVHEVDVLEASLKYISDVAKQGDKSATMLARYGIVDQVVLVLEGFSKENALVSLSLDVLSTVSRAPPPEKVSHKDKASEARRSPENSATHTFTERVLVAVMHSILDPTRKPHSTNSSATTVAQALRLLTEGLACRSVLDLAKRVHLFESIALLTAKKLPGPFDTLEGKWSPDVYTLLPVLLVLFASLSLGRHTASESNPSVSDEALATQCANSDETIKLPLCLRSVALQCALSLMHWLSHHTRDLADVRASRDNNNSNKPGSRERQSSRTNSDAKPLEMKHRSSSEKLDSSLSKRKSRQVSLGGTRSSGSSVESPRVSEMVVNKMASVKEHALRLIRAIVDEEPTLPEADRVLGQLDDPLNAGIVDAVLHVVSASKNQAAVVVPGLFALRALLACGLKPPSFNKMASVIIDSEQAISSSSADDAVAVAITLLHDARGVRAASVDEAEICAQLKMLVESWSGKLDAPESEKAQALFSSE